MPDTGNTTTGGSTPKTDDPTTTATKLNDPTLTIQEDPSVDSSTPEEDPPPES